MSSVTQLREQEEIDDLFNDLSALLHHAWAIYKTIDRAASSAQVYHNLAALRDMSDKDCLLSIAMTDPETLAAIYPHYPGGWGAMEETIDVGALKNAVNTAFQRQAKPPRGRPAGTHYEVYRFLAKELPVIFSGTGNRPTRRTDWMTNASYGPFKTFVTTLLSIVPGRCRRRHNGQFRDVDYLVQLAMNHFTARQAT